VDKYRGAVDTVSSNPFASQSEEKVNPKRRS
jgi:hypothetical protein